MTTALTLYHFPGACSRVSLCALEMAGLEYRLQLINIRTDEQNSRAYLEMSPLGKVPVLEVDGHRLTENIAIISHIADQNPSASILPALNQGFERIEAVSGMAFCASTLHPQLRGLVNPQRLTSGDPEGLRSRSHELLYRSFGFAEARLAERGWWLRKRSIVDVYLDWAVFTARRGDFNFSPFPRLEGLSDRLQDLDGYTRMLRREAEARVALRL